MSALHIGGTVFVSVFLGASIGILLRRILPDHHLSAESKDVVKVGAGFIATMSALLLGLLVASAKGSYDVKRTELTQMSAKVMFLDRLLATYGPDTQEAREVLRGLMEHAVERLWPKDGAEPVQLDPPTNSGIKFFAAIEHLAPANDRQRLLKAHAESLAIEIGELRWLLLAQRESSISTPMLVVVVFWLTIIFTSYGLFAPTNPTVIATLFLCAVAVAGAFFLVLELDQPFGGFMQIPSESMRMALEHLGK